MSTTAADTAVTASIVVEVPAERAFAVFTAGGRQGGLALFAARAGG